MKIFFSKLTIIFTYKSIDKYNGSRFIRYTNLRFLTRRQYIFFYLINFD
jgi:hypothetical protein